MKPSKKSKSENSIDAMSADDALVILRTLAQEDINIAKRIEQLAMDDLRDVDIDVVAEEVCWALDDLEVEEVWNRSGSTRDGYMDPIDVAYEMFEEALAPFATELKKCRKLSLFEQEKSHCMGILKGIYKFDRESASQYKDWAADAPSEYFSITLDDWNAHCKKPKYRKEMEAFIKKNFPDWEN